MKLLALVAVLASCVVIAGCSGCDDATEGRKAAVSIAKAIARVCGTAEGRETGGPRTITPIDLDGSDGPSGFLVTCVNGRTEYVEAP